MGHRLLILSCSQRKRPDPGLLPAIERYDGPAFRVLRKYLRAAPPDAPAVFILSARFGFIPMDTPIPTYDQRMTQERACELRSSVHAALKRVIAELQPVDSAHLHLSRHYFDTIDGWSDLFLPGIASVGEGIQGVKLGRLRTWLYGTPKSPRAQASRRSPQHPIQLRGITLHCSSDEALETARRALDSEPAAAFRFYSWFVEIDGVRVAPKWLVSTLTGIPVSQFVTTEAIRVLDQLGVEVRQM